MKNYKSKSDQTKEANIEIGKQLKSGDKVFIARATGFSRCYITDIFKGRRKNSDVTKLALKLIRSANKIQKEFKQQQ